MNVVKYGTPSAKFREFREQGPVIFLAGPTVRGNQPHLTSWRIAAVEEFKKRDFKGTLILPEFEDKLESDQFRYDLPAWEFAGLEAADVIMFWIPRTRELIGLTTNFELGYWLGREPLKVTYGRPDDAYRIKYCDLMWEIENIRSRTGAEKEIMNKLSDLVLDSMYIAESNYRYRTGNYKNYN